jgi:cephalosporin hydroxylase
VIHDASHAKEHVLNSLETYSSLVSIGSYFIVEDTIQDVFEPGDGLGGFGEGPLRAIEEFLEKNPPFVVDEERERYLLTYNPKGFLKRLR